MSETRPQVSVVIPVFNGINYIEEAINSVLAQSYENQEIVVVDDGSTDGTWELLKKYKSKVRSFRKENGGVASALNLGLGEMRGVYFAWLSHDDVFLPEKTARQVDFLQKNESFAACYSDYFRIDSEGKILREIAHALAASSKKH